MRECIFTISKKYTINKVRARISIFWTWDEPLKMSIADMCILEIKGSNTHGASKVFKKLGLYSWDILKTQEKCLANVLTMFWPSVISKLS